MRLGEEALRQLDHERVTALLSPGVTQDRVCDVAAHADGLAHTADLLEA